MDFLLDGTILSLHISILRWLLVVDRRQAGPLNALFHLNSLIRAAAGERSADLLEAFWAAAQFKVARYLVF